MIPGFKYYFYPCLAALENGKGHIFADVKNFTANYLKLSESDKAVRLKSGSYRHNDRCSWALAYLKRLKLVTSSPDKQYLITKAGLEVLEKYGDRFDLSVVRDMEGFVDFQQTRATNGYWRPSHYTATGRYVPGYVSKWEYKGRQRMFSTREEAIAYMNSKKVSKSKNVR